MQFVIQKGKTVLIMKKQKFWWILSALLFLSFLVYSQTYAGGTKIKFNALPQAAQTFYTMNFENIKIKEVEHDKIERKYEIDLWNNCSITFNHKGEWTEVDCNKDSVVPQSVIDQLPLLIKNKIYKEYSKNLIIEIKRNLRSDGDHKYSIEIIDTNGKEVEVKLN